MGKGLNELRDEALRIASEHGFKDASIGEDIALMHSELSEALEDHRAGKLAHEMTYTIVLRYPDDRREIQADVAANALEALRADRKGSWPVLESAKPCGIPSELADVIIRVLHFSGKHGIEKAVTEKMAFNESRPFKHGGKTL